MRMRLLFIFLFACCSGLTALTGHAQTSANGCPVQATCEAGYRQMNIVFDGKGCISYTCEKDAAICPERAGCEDGTVASGETFDANGCKIFNCKPQPGQCVQSVSCPEGYEQVPGKAINGCAVYSCKKLADTDNDCPNTLACPGGYGIVGQATSDGCPVLKCKANTNRMCFSRSLHGLQTIEACPMLWGLPAELNSDNVPAPTRRPQSR